MENIQFYLTGYTLFGSIALFNVLFFGFLLTLLFSEVKELGVLAVLAVIIVLVLNHFWGNYPIENILTLKNVVLYLIIGFIFSIIRAFFKGKELTDEQKKCYELKEAVFRWWFLFPFAMINWFFGRILKDVYNWIYLKLEKFYKKVFGMPENSTRDS